MVNYEKFDKETRENKIFNNIKSVLQKKPLRKEELYKQINSEMKDIDEQLYILMQKKIVLKRMINKVHYYGLDKRFRRK